MADPAIIETTKEAWTKVATNVTSGRIFTKNAAINYSQTYRLTGEAAPTDMTDAIHTLQTGVEEISSSDAIDVYLYNHNEVAGSVRVDI